MRLLEKIMLTICACKHCVFDALYRLDDRPEKKGRK
jgi:hypothetical protein